MPDTRPRIQGGLPTRNPRPTPYDVARDEQALLGQVIDGRYRVDATDRGPLRLTVFEGHGTMRSPSNTIGVGSFQAVGVSPDGSAFDYEQALTTGFDQWALARDEHAAIETSAQMIRNSLERRWDVEDIK